VIELKTIVRDAIPGDLLYIDSLRKKEGSSLGFIPKGAYESIIYKKPINNRNGFLYSRLLVTEDNNDLTGFCYYSFISDIINIFQIVVQEDARKWHRALKMIEIVEEDVLRYNRTGIKCRVAYDLESNYFWRAIGFKPMELVISTFLNQRESKSKRPLWVYFKDYGIPIFKAERDQVKLFT